MKKLVSLILAIIMIAVMGTAWAADTGDAYNGASQTRTTGASIPLTKTIVFINKNASQVYEPNISYTYAITPANPGTATVTDAESDTVRVSQGVNGGVTGTTIAFASANTAVATYSTGNQITKTSNLTVVFGTGGTATFPHAGVYRYLITESTSVTPSSVGITRDATDYVSTRYLDVYIGNGGTVDADTNPLGLKLLGAVIFKTVNTTNPGQDSINHNDTNDQKTTGFEPGIADGTPSTTDYTNDTTVDRYTTYDFTISKEVTGSLADKTHEFPFYVTVTNTINGAAYTYIKDTTGNEAPATASQDATTTTKFTAGATTQTVGTDAATSVLKLKDGESITFRGLPSNTTSALSVSVKEFNDTVDQYTASVKANVGGTANTALTTDPANGIMTASTGTVALASVFDVKTNDVASQTIAVTNNVSEISPTGYVSRFAPYALLLVGGIVLLIIAKKKKPAKDDEE